MANKTNTATRLDNLRDDEKARVDSIAVGTDDSAPTVNDTSLGNQVLEKSATHEDGGTGEFTSIITLTTAEANGQSLVEVGELTTADDLLSRIVHAAIDKDSAFELEYRLKKTMQNEE